MYNGNNKKGCTALTCVVEYMIVTTRMVIIMLNNNYDDNDIIIIIIIIIVIQNKHLFLTPNSRSAFRAGVSLNIHSFIHSFKTNKV